MTRQPTPGLHENFAEEAAMSADKAMVTYPTLRGGMSMDIQIKPLEWRKEATWAQAQCPVFGTVSVFLHGGYWAWSLPSVNCASRSSTIEKAIEKLEEERERRIQSTLSPSKIEAGENTAETAPAPQTTERVSDTPSAALEASHE